MVALRKASSYSKKKARPYTRNSRTKRKAFIKVVPSSKITKFNMGNVQDYIKEKHNFIVRFISSEGVQIRDNALESCRTLVNKVLDAKIPGQYYFSMKVYPHHLLRENKTAAGAGADRLSSGMRHSFGIVIGRAAIVKPGQEVFFISSSSDKSARIARDALSAVKAKIPCTGKIVFEEIRK